MEMCSFWATVRSCNVKKAIVNKQRVKFEVEFVVYLHFVTYFLKLRCSLVLTDIGVYDWLKLCRQEQETLFVKLSRWQTRLKLWGHIGERFSRTLL